MGPFVIKEKVQPSFVESVLKREPKFNAVIDINNLLATKPIKEVTSEEVISISRGYNVDIKVAYREHFQDFYSLYLKHCFEDNKFTEKEIDNLIHLKRLLWLTDEEIFSINELIGSHLYQKETTKALEDGRLTKEEKRFLEQLKTTLELHESIAQKIYAQAAENYFADFFNAITSDNRISEEEEKELHEIAKSLNLDVDMDEAARSTYDKMKLLWLIENDRIPPIAVSLPLVITEQCFFKTEINWMGCVKKTKHVDENLKQGKKVSLATIKAENELNSLDKGTVYLTNKRIIFTGGKITKSIYFNKIEEYITFLNGVEIHHEDGKINFIRFTDHVEVFTAIMSKIC